MQNGGKRAGAGRKPGAVTVRTRQIAEKAIAEGITPLDVMLDNMRFFHEAAGIALKRLLEGSATPADIISEHEPQQGAPDPEKPAPNAVEAVALILKLRDRAGEAAKDAAPYLHSRIAAIEPKDAGKDVVPLAERLKAYTTDEVIEASKGKVVKLKKKR